MNHGYYQDRLSAYFDQALTPEEMRAIKEHLESCAECREQLDNLAKLDQLIEKKSGLGESDYWEKAAQKIEKKIATEENSKVTDVRSGWFGIGWKFAAAAASVAALTFVALHEGEIQETVNKQAESSPKVSTQQPIDSTPVYLSDDIMFGAETTQPEPVQKPSIVQTEPKEKPSDIAKAPPATIVETVDELLEETAGVVTNSSDEIFIRGGRAGETEYVVNSEPTTDTEGTVVDLGTISLTKKQTDIGSTISVSGSRDAIDKFETSYKSSIIQEPQDSTDQLTEIDSYRATRDSLQTYVAQAMRVLNSPSFYADKKSDAGAKVKGVATSQKSSTTPPDQDSSKVPTQTVLERYLEACYKIAELTDRESEYDSALAVIERHARDRNSPQRDLARHYLDKIDALQE